MSVCVSASVCMSIFGDGKRNEDKEQLSVVPKKKED